MKAVGGWGSVLGATAVALVGSSSSMFSAPSLVSSDDGGGVILSSSPPPRLSSSLAPLLVFPGLFGLLPVE